MAQRMQNPMRVWKIIGAVISALALAFLVLPIVVILPLSLSSGSFLSYPLPGISTQWYAELFTNYKWALALRNSAIIGVCAALLATLLGTSAAIALHGMRGAWKAALTGLMMAPLMTPLVIIAVSLFLFYSQMGMTGTMVGIILAHTLLGVPFVIVSALAGLQNFDMALMRAARSLGGSPWYCYRRVMLPLLRPALISGMLFAFITSFDEIVVVLFLAGPEQITLPIRLFEGIRDELTPVVISAAVIMILISVVSMLLVESLRKQSDTRQR